MAYDSQPITVIRKPLVLVREPVSARVERKMPPPSQSQKAALDSVPTIISPPPAFSQLSLDTPPQPIDNQQEIPSDPQVKAPDQPPDVALPKHVPILNPGLIIKGKYIVEAFIGAGGFGSVYRVKRVADGATVALKVVYSNKRNDESLRTEYDQTSDFPLSRHLLKVYDFGTFTQPVTDKKITYLAMDYIEGLPLSDIIKAKGRLPLTNTLDIMFQIAYALNKAGTLHADLKPGNVLITQEGLVVIIDFGLAKRAQQQILIGTPLYMSPEQLCGTAVNHQSDMFALALIGRQMLTGQAPTSDEGADILANLNKFLRERRTERTIEIPLAEISTVMSHINLPLMSQIKIPAKNQRLSHS